MAESVDTSHLLARLEAAATAAGLVVRADGAGGLAGEVQSIRAKWWLGGRKVVYRMSCRPAEADRVVHFREAVVETSWGLPPPTFTVETETVSGWKRSGTRTDKSIGGGGTLDFARVRDALDQCTTAAGWRFHLDGGRLP